MKNSAKTKLDEFSTPTNIKLALLWASLMFLYIYNDYFSMYTHRTIDDMAKGRLGPLGQATEPVLAGVAVMLAIPALMIFLSATLRPLVSRWLNVALGIAYTGIEVLTLSGAPLFYRIVVVLEIALTVLILWHALQWPKHAPPE
ncbi:MAG TPA: DUF6326 family protein [Steroidobacteraceae bacterium]